MALASRAHKLAKQACRLLSEPADDVNAVYAMATVTQISERREECGSYSIMESVYDSRLEFVAKDGSTVRFTQEHGQSEPAFSKGDQVRIRYEAAHAAKSAQVPSKIEDVALWLTIILSALMGSAFLAAALAKK
jgi:hypothetical protein